MAEMVRGLFSDQKPPTFQAAEGSFSVDYRDYDGVIVLGEGDWKFRTTWSTAGSGSIHVYREPGSPSVAVAPLAKRITDVTAEIFGRANFTSRVRTPRVGEVVLLKNTKGYAAAVEIIRVQVSPESMPGTQLTARYRILTDKTHDFTNALTSSQLEMGQAVDEAITALVAIPLSSDAPIPSVGIGHNNPPLNAPLEGEEHRAIVQLLRDLRSNLRSLTDSFVKAVIDGLKRANNKILDWAAERFKLIREGFYRQLGSAAATALIGTGAWFVIAGKLEAVLNAIAAFARTAFGWAP